MWMPLALSLQTGETAGPPAPTPPKISVEGRCPSISAGDDAVVCGRINSEVFRLRPLPATAARREGLPLARMRLGPGVIGLETEAAAVGNTPTNRAKVTFRMPF